VSAAGELDAEIAATSQELRRSAGVLVCWRRRGGGLVRASAVMVRLPGAREPMAVSDAELAALRCLELAGEMEVVWPFNAGLGKRGGGQPHAPLAPEVEAAALALRRRRAAAGAPEPSGTTAPTC
jgi:hypothetical protein